MEKDGFAVDRKISKKEERFCLEYAIDYNGTQAARRAGYTDKSAAKAACALLKRPEIMDEVKRLQREQAERLCLSSDLVVTRTLELLDKCMANVPVMEWDYDTHQMVESGQYQVDSRGAARCLEILAKHIGMLDARNTAAPADANVKEIVAEVERMVADAER